MISEAPDGIEKDGFFDECGIFAVVHHNEAAALTALGLHALQHRGQEGVGILSLDHRPATPQFHVERAKAMVGDVFSADSGQLEKLKGQTAIGHVRYSTAGGDDLRNLQPLFAELPFGGFGLAHNGNVTNAQKMRKRLVKKGAIFQGRADTEVLIHLMAHSLHRDPERRFVDALNQLEGAWSLVALARDRLIAARDPWGVRPLVLGRLGKAWILASETCALDIIGAEFLRDVDPGEVLVFPLGDEECEPQSLFPFPKKDPRPCVFEYLYFARPDSLWNGIGVYEARKAVGRRLAEEAPAEADLVSAIPDSGVPAALGYAEASAIPYEMAIIRNHYVGRTFIEPGQKMRDFGVKLKHNANRSKLEGRSLVLVDDSIVRGTTIRKIIAMVRDSGARKVHLRIAAPPTRHPCYYGIDTPEQDQLMAWQLSTEEICKAVNADSLAYISLDGLYRALGKRERHNKSPGYCDACFTGDYPLEKGSKTKEAVGERSRR